MMEYAAEFDDELMMKYLDGEELTVEEIRSGLAAGIAAPASSCLVLGRLCHQEHRRQAAPGC